jgi:putative transposase
VCQRCGKKVAGRKRHLAVDTLGLLIACVVHAASVQDYDSVEFVLDKVKRRFPRLKKVFADSNYACKQTVLCVWVIYRFVLEIVRHPVGRFEVVAKRWIVERTFARLGQNRHLSKYYDR